MLPFKNVTASSFKRNSAQTRRNRTRHTRTSCIQCRKAKTRCNLERPCRQCVLNGQSATCVYSRDSSNVASKGRSEFEEYDSFPGPGRSPLQSSPTTPLTPIIHRHVVKAQSKSHQDRASIAPARELSTCRLISNRASNEILRLPPIHHISNSLICDQPQSRHFQGRYVGGTHWSSLLALIPEVRLYLEKDPKFQNIWPILIQLQNIFGRPEPSVPKSPFGWNPNPQDILVALLPSQPIRDVLYQNFWSTTGQMMPFVQKASFDQKYQGLFVEATQSDIYFSLQLSVILGLGYITDVSTHEIDLTLPEKQARGRDMFEAVEKIVLTYNRVRKPSLALLEVFLLLFTAKDILSETDGPNGMCALLGIAQRMSFTLGLHREPHGYNNISTEQNERRRQLWAIIRISNHEYSIHSGTPQTIRDDQCDCLLPTVNTKQDPDRDETFRLAWFTSLATVERQSDTLILQAHQETPTSSEEIRGRCASIILDINSFKVSLDREVARLTKLWISCGMPKIFAFYHLILNIIWHRTSMLLYHTCLSMSPQETHMAWPHYTKSAASLLTVYHEFLDSQPNISDSWWQFYHSFVQYDIYRAAFGLCYAARRMVKDHLQAMPMAFNISPSQSSSFQSLNHAHPIIPSHEDESMLSIHDMLVLVEKTRDLMKRNIPAGINYVKAFQLLNMAIVCVDSEISGTDALASSRREAEHALKVAYEIQVVSLSDHRAAASTMTTKDTASGTPHISLIQRQHEHQTSPNQGDFGRRGSTQMNGSILDINQDGHDGEIATISPLHYEYDNDDVSCLDIESIVGAPDWEWYDQLVRPL